jgi:integrase
MKRIARNLFKHQNGTYYTLSRINGKQVKRSLGTADKSLAKQLLKKARLGGGLVSPWVQAAPVPSSNSSRPNFVDALELHEAHCAFASPKTSLNLRTRKRTVLRFCKTWRDFHPVEIWNKFNAEGWTAAQNQLRWFLRSFTQYCLEREWLSAAEVSGKIPRKLVSSRRVKIPPPQLVSDLLKMCEAEHKEIGQFIRFIAYTGVRLTGARFIRWEDIDLSVPEYTMVMKGGARATIPLLPEAANLLQSRWVAAGKPKRGLVFEMGDCRIKKARRILRKYSVGLGLDLSYPHALRHAFASVAFASGLSAGEVAKMLGHRDGGQLALAVYGHVIPSQLKSKVNALRIAA